MHSDPQIDLKADLGGGAEAISAHAVETARGGAEPAEPVRTALLGAGYDVLSWAN
jgi:hypothetical protein